jgi:hypothetical protein
MPPPRSWLPLAPVAAPLLITKPSSTAVAFVPPLVTRWKLLSPNCSRPSSPARSPLSRLGAVPKGGRSAGEDSVPTKEP